MNENFLNNTVFPIIHAALGLGNSDYIGDIDYTKLIELSKRQAILPIIREGLRKLEIKGYGYSLVDHNCIKDIYFYAYRDIALETICSCFEKNTFHMYYLKGSTLKNLYPDPWMRTSSDIDVLVKETELNRAISVLEKDSDFNL